MSRSSRAEDLRAQRPGARVLRLRELLTRAGEPQVFFPLIALLVLTVVWGTTISLIGVERRTAERAAVASALELADTYEAHVLRNLREIDHTLKVVKFAYQTTGNPRVLAELRERGLLPPELIFAVTIANRDGRVLGSTGAFDAVYVGVDVWEQLHSDELRMSRPRQNVRTGEWQLHFSLPLRGRDRRFAGIVTLSVDAAYFVSDYERGKLGDRGVLGLIGSDDGVFRVRRTGEHVAVGDEVPHAAFDPRSREDTVFVQAQDAWDRVQRVSSIRKLYAFPLALVVGLSSDEQLAATQEKARAYLWRAGLASVLLLLLIGAMGRTSWKLAQTARRENEAKLAHAERIQYLAYRDALTDLPNRALFGKMIEQGINRARRYGRTLAILFIDLDRFKQINDTLGHASGDRYLCEMAKRLQSCLRESDTVARFGGDEFVVLLPECDEDLYGATVAHKLLAAIAQPFELAGQRVIGTASIGIAVYPRDGGDELALMKYADMAMYHAKDQGKNNFQYYSSQLQVNSLNRLKLETSLRQALDRREFALCYQAKVELATNSVVGMEALLRWHSPEHGLVPPAEFVPIAEDTGLIGPIGRWALETACAQNVQWQRAGLPHVSVAVNLSARQFNDERLLEDVKEILDRTGLDPQLLELEITESMLMHNVEKAIRTLRALSDLKLRLAIDDFGTGYSSLSNLKRFPLNTLKIDRSFINELPYDADDRVITDAIIGMGHALSLTVVAEGVEAQSQADYLRERGCDQHQGYHFSMPLPAAEFGALLRAQPQLSMSVEPARGPRRALPRADHARQAVQQQRKQER